MSGSQRIDGTSGAPDGGGSGSGGGAGKHTAGAFDVRSVIAGLIGLFGIVLIVVGLIDDSEEALAKAGGVNANLWSGLGMLAVAIAFALWVYLRPIVLEDAQASQDD